MASCVTRLRVLSYAKSNLSKGNLSKYVLIPINLVIDSTPIKSYSVILRGISNFSKTVFGNCLRPIKPKLVICNNKTHKFLKFTGPNVTYSCTRSSSVSLDVFCQPELGDQSHNFGEATLLQYQGVAVRNNAVLQNLENKGNSKGELFHLEQCSKPVLPSLDDIQIDNCFMKSSASVKEVFCNLSNENYSTSPISSELSIVKHSVLQNGCSIQGQAQNSENEFKYCNISRKCSLDMKQTSLLCSSLSAKPSEKQAEPSGLRKPSEEKLLHVFDKLSKELPELFIRAMDFRIYSLDLVFENRVNGTRTVGIFPYMRQASVLRILGHLKYAYVSFEILKITQHPEDSTIRVRWRIVGVSALKALPYIFTLQSYTLKDAKEKMDDWYDGFSIFYVGEDGLVYKHVADTMMPDEELGVVKKMSLAARLVALIGLSPKVPTPSQAAVTSSLERVTKEENSQPLPSTTKALVSSLVLGGYFEYVI